MSRASNKMISRSKSENEAQLAMLKAEEAMTRTLEAMETMDHVEKQMLEAEKTGVNEMETIRELEQRAKMVKQLAMIARKRAVEAAVKQAKVKRRSKSRIMSPELGIAEKLRRISNFAYVEKETTESSSWKPEPIPAEAESLQAVVPDESSQIVEPSLESVEDVSCGN